MKDKNVALDEIRKKCTGCGACFELCPKQCIEMIQDHEGFYIPSIHKAQCINCGSCYANCPAVTEKSATNKPFLSYAAIWKDKIAKQSTSGGIFAMLAKYWVLEKKGHVYGCGFDDKIIPKHICIKSVNDLHKLQGSKYVQSYSADAFVQVKKDLENGIDVLFSGTPCQIHGLQSCLKKKYKNLVCIDIICHGTPSPLLFSHYIKWLEKDGGKVVSYRFRNKDKYSIEGYKAKYKVVKCHTKSERIVDAYSDPYFAAFARQETFRQSCYSCSYTTLNRYGDITLGDCSSVRTSKATPHNPPIKKRSHGKSHITA